MPPLDGGNTEDLLKQVTKQLDDVGDKLKAQADAAIKAKGDLSLEIKNKADELLTKQTELTAKQTALQAKLEESGTKVEARLTDIEQKLAARPGPDNTAKVSKTIGRQVIESDKLKDLKAEAFRGNLNVTVKLTPAIRNAMFSADLSTGIVEPMRDPLLPRLRSRLFVRDLLSVGPTSSPVIQWVRQTGFTNNAAVVSEGTLKPLSTITYDLVNTMVTTIAHLFKAAKQLLDDFPRLMSDIDDELRYGLRQAEENEILFGDGTGAHLDGIIPQATAYAAAFTPAAATLIDQIRLAMLQAQLAKLPPTGIVMHFTDWARIETTKDTTGQYIFANPLRLADPNLWGLPIVATDLTAMEDHFLTGAFAGGAKLYDREDANVQISTENNDDFEKNMMTVRCEERVALAVKRPEAFIWGTFTGVSGS